RLLQSLLALKRRVDFKLALARWLRRFAEKNSFIGVELLREIGAPSAKNLAKIIVNRGIIVDHEDAMILCGRCWRKRAHVCATGAATGSSRVKVAPWPIPALATDSEPPIARAARAPLCNPKPCPSFLVVNP